MKDRECVELLQWALPRLGLRWEGFRRVRGQVCKRIGRRIAELGLDSPREYRRRLEADPAEWLALDGLCQVTITRFYRDRAVFEHLRTAVLPRCAAVAWDEKRPVRVWSAGCASGEEPYSVALTFHLGTDAPGEVGLELVATDANEGLLSRGRHACYAPGTLRELPQEWREVAFFPDEEELCLRPSWKEGVRFLRQDLRVEMPEGPFDVVLCRNLAFTFFGPALQRRTLAGMLTRLRQGGSLVIGAHERLPGSVEGLGQEGALPVWRWTRQLGHGEMLHV